jgi:hypothetical protein
MGGGALSDGLPKGTERRCPMVIGTPPGVCALKVQTKLLTKWAVQLKVLTNIRPVAQ